MRKIPLATATILGCGALCGATVSAQQVYGIMDAAVGVINNGKGTTKQVMPGGQSASRWGITGTEDLGGGLRAFFRLESQVNLDDGSFGAGAFWGRRSHVGLAGSFGEVMLGRDYSPGFYTVLQNDIGGLAFFGTLQSVHTLDIETPRFNNGIFYTSPDFAGLQFRAAVSLGERADPPRDGGNAYGVSASYKAGPLRLNVYLHDLKVATTGQTSSSTRKQFGGGGGWDFGDWRLTAGFGTNDPPAANDRVSFASFGTAAKFGGTSEVLAQVIRLKSDVTGGKATTVGAAYVYSLSKRTNLYASVGKTNNDGKGAFPLNNSQNFFAPGAAGLDVTGTMIGMRHTF